MNQYCLKKTSVGNTRKMQELYPLNTCKVLNSTLNNSVVRNMEDDVHTLYLRKNQQTSCWQTQNLRKNIYQKLDALVCSFLSFKSKCRWKQEPFFMISFLTIYLFNRLMTKLLVFLSLDYKKNSSLTIWKKKTLEGWLKIMSVVSSLYSNKATFFQRKQRHRWQEDSTFRL